jgi:hypothetical protein
MDRIRFFRTVKAVEREAAHWGYHGDALADEGRIPDVGTYDQQMAIATIGVDVLPGPMSTRDRQLVNRMIRGAVLLSRPPREEFPKVDNTRIMARERRRSA